VHSDSASQSNSPLETVLTVWWQTSGLLLAPNFFNPGKHTLLFAVLQHFIFFIVSTNLSIK